MDSKLIILIFCALYWAFPVHAQVSQKPLPGQDLNNTWTANNTFSNLNGIIAVDGTKYPQTEAGINAALAAATDGTTIYLPAATYSIASGIVVNKRVNIQCSPSMNRDTAPVGGSQLSGSGITIMDLQVSGIKIDGCIFRDPTGNASTIGLLIESNVNDAAMSNWSVTRCNFYAVVVSRLGIGLKLTGALKGEIVGNNFEGWNVALDLNKFTTGPVRSNSNDIHGNRFRSSTTGVKFETDSADSETIASNVIENNNIGLSADSTAGDQMNITLVGNHFENGFGASPGNVSISGNVALTSTGNYYCCDTANKDIVIAASDAYNQVSTGDFLFLGITHNGTGGFSIINTLGNNPTVSQIGTGPVDYFQLNGNAVALTGRNRSGQAFNIAGYALLRSSTVIADQGVACTNGELALSAGWQSTGSATVTNVAGNGQTCSWTITTGTTTAANPTITDTLTNTLPAATTVCEMNIHGGTHTAVAGESFQQTTLSVTAPVFTANFTPTAGGTTYLVTRSCGP